ncbi:hypothetical protein GJAV_G00188980 [Gymnothorax javanicus]|nr:hypothetical protein GJAV_G00188980 [Gymnothorax javanicus]
MASENGSLGLGEPSTLSPAPQESNRVSHMDIQGYSFVRWRTWLCHAVSVLSLGLLPLLFHWRPHLRVLACCRPCSLGQADTLLLRDSCGQLYVVEVLTVEIEEGSMGLAGSDFDEAESRDTIQLYKDEKPLLRYYILEGLRYVWMARKGAFCPVSALNEHWTCDDLYLQQAGLSLQEQSARRRVYGQNLIDVPVKSYLRLLFEEVLNPFYVFQVLSMLLWTLDKYYYYAGCIFVISVISIGISLYEIHKQSVTLHNMAQLIVSVRVRRDTGAVDMVGSTDLVPGDCIEIPEEGILLPCDAALLVGECMVNESMLTGESIPVMKTPLPKGQARYSPDSMRRHTLFCGTQVIQAKGGQQGGTGALAVITCTGFFTAKGDLISSILYPQPLNFRFYRDAVKFLIILAAFALMGTVYSLVILSQTATTLKELIIRSLDVVTIVVPPALPAAITTGTIYAQRRLKKNGIFCISPPRINISGKLSLVCFDKTGTLTEEGLDVWGVMEGSGAGFGELVPDPRLLPPGPLLSALACCHSVALLGEQLLGDPLELKMIESTGWVLEEPSPGEAGAEGEFGAAPVVAVMRPPSIELQPHGISIREPVAIVQRFPFSSALQRMCVVTVDLGGRSARTFLKGAPEMVASLCQKESVPAQFTETLRHFASEGFRVLALAFKPLDVQIDISTVERGALESQLQFLGLLVMRNLVKPESADVINTLRRAQLRTVMVTGDNILTAVNVARACGIVRKDERVYYVQASPPTGHSPPSLQFLHAAADDHSIVLTQGLYQGSSSYHLAINGQSFSSLCDHFPEYLPKVLMRGSVYARMAPEQKTQLVKLLQKLDYRVGMCGDGANDCGALRAADVGVSLSEAEASVASPFTSKSDNISCVPLLIREGRCSLVTSFSLFKYMALYSLIQFSSVLILYTVKTNLGDLQFLFFDLVVVTSLAIVMGRGGPSKELHPQRPPGSLLSVPVLASFLLHTLLLILAQIGALMITKSQDWFVPLNSTVVGAANLPNLEDTGVFAISGFQYIIMAVVVTKGHPFKKHFCSNVMFVCVLLILCGFMCWLVLYPPSFLRRALDLYDVTNMDYKLLLVALAALNLFTCYLLEMLIDNGMCNCLRNLKRHRESKKQYKRLDAALLNSRPPLDQALYSQQSNSWP